MTMSTLHVRNVPDDLYELLRDRAAAHDRSIGAETVQLLQETLSGSGAAGARPAGRRFHLGGRRRSPGSGTFARFAAGGRQVVLDAQEQARALGHDHVGTEHLLLGVLCADDEEPAVHGLRAVGLTAAAARAEVERLVGRGDTHRLGQLPFHPSAKQALELSLREAAQLRDGHIGPEHILLGVIAQGSGAGAEIVRAAEPDGEKLRAVIVRERHGAAFAPRTARFRVVQLKGDAAAWEAALNDAARSGYELAYVVEGRAIFKLH
ncbi:MAG: Arc family DNA-binding protein [Solirubrobacterales bacterium]|nr:Arc family DNA-binding protein [Solirubrobacterales bacterium]